MSNDISSDVHAWLPNCTLSAKAINGRLISSPHLTVVAFPNPVKPFHRIILSNSLCCELTKQSDEGQLLCVCA